MRRWRSVVLILLVLVYGVGRIEWLFWQPDITAIPEARCLLEQYDAAPERWVSCP